jgi:hypothetical protein
MGKVRDWNERRNIIRSVIAETQPPNLDTFNLSPSEEVFYRARAVRAVDALATKTSAFKAYYALPAANPFGYVFLTSALIVLFAIFTGIYLWLRTADASAYPLFGALMALCGLAIGWSITGWISHRNTIRQNTNNILFARFSQATFGEAMHRFHDEFGFDVEPRVTRNVIRANRLSGVVDKVKSAEAVVYLLNYFEFIASGVLRGDLDKKVVRQNVKGVICYYYDKCEPNIREANRINPKVYEYLIKLRTHYREP